MSPTARRRGVALSAVLAASAVSCTLLNPLDHLQAGRDPSTPGGPPAQSDGGTENSDGASSGDADNAPGCGPSRWSECGVKTVSDAQEPGGAAFFGDTLYFTDRASGTIFVTSCSTGTCAPPTPLITGETRPDRLALAGDSLYWTTPTQVRRQRVTPYDAATPIDTLDTVEGDAEIAGEWEKPLVVWTDAKGTRGTPTSGGLVTFWGKPALSPTLAPQGPAFISEGEVKVCTYSAGQGTNCPGQVAVPQGSAGATIVHWELVFYELLTGSAGLIAALPQGAGSRLVVLDHVDDAGTATVLADDVAPVRSIVGAGSYVYWTNAAGELRRAEKKDPTAPVKTILRGLSDDTTLLSSSHPFIVIVDRGGKRVSNYVP